MKGGIFEITVQILKTTNKKIGTALLLLLALIDSSVFPVPVTTLFLIMLLAEKERQLEYIGSIITGTLIGALAGNRQLF